MFWQSGNGSKWFLNKQKFEEKNPTGKIAPIFVVLLFWKYIFCRHYFPLQMLLVTFWWWSKVANGKSVWFRGNTIECVGPIWFQLLPGRALFCVSRRALPYTDDHDKDNVAGIHFNFIFCHHQGFSALKIGHIFENIWNRNKSDKLAEPSYNSLIYNT